MRNLLVASLFFSLSLLSFGQKNASIAYIDLNNILNSLPVTDSIQAALEAERIEFEGAFQEMNTEYNKFLDEFQKNQETYSELIKQTKSGELLDKQKRLNEFEQNANNALQQHNSEMIQPVYAKISEAIKKISEEKNIDYVIDLSKGSVVYTSETALKLDDLVIAIVK
ncbi:MAG: OmpH family outer membrane protein [Bacteroidales bacterium]|nr:OmpH family outer membrane protein [Bacteroidales bacterium]